MPRLLRMPGISADAEEVVFLEWCSTVGSTVAAGAAIEYYSDRRKDKEQDFLKHWIVEELQEDLDKNAADSKYPTLYSYVRYDPITDNVNTDMALIMLSIVLVCAYMWFYIGSAFVMACGMFQIFASFFCANLIYRYLWPTASGFGYQFFTLFSALSLFIIMGIGADDLFVFWDVWTASKDETWRDSLFRESRTP